MFIFRERKHPHYVFLGGLLLVFDQIYIFFDDIAAPSISQSSKLEDAWASGPIAAYSGLQYAKPMLM